MNGLRHEDDYFIEVQSPDSALVAEWDAREAQVRDFSRAAMLRRNIARDTMARPAPRPVPRLIGTRRYPGDDRYLWNLVYLNGTIIIGWCAAICFDGSPTYLTLTHRVADGYRGNWVDYMTGIGVLVQTIHVVEVGKLKPSSS